MVVSQLRIYTINKGKLDEFVEGWKQFIHPLHLKHGYTIDLAQIIRERNEFVWIVSYDGPEDWEKKQAAYYGSDDRKNINPDPAQYIAKAERWFIEPVLTKK